MSDPMIATLISFVARNLPDLQTSATNSPSFASTIGLRPLFSISTLVGLTSKPITLWPLEARHVAVTDPTYPNPKTLTESIGTLYELKCYVVDSRGKRSPDSLQ